MMVSVVDCVGLGGKELVCFYSFFALSYVVMPSINSRYFQLHFFFDTCLLLGYVLSIVQKSNRENFPLK